MTRIFQFGRPEKIVCETDFAEDRLSLIFFANGVELQSYSTNDTQLRVKVARRRWIRTNSDLPFNITKANESTGIEVVDHVAGKEITVVLTPKMLYHNTKVACRTSKYNEVCLHVLQKRVRNVC